MAMLPSVDAWINQSINQSINQYLPAHAFCICLSMYLYLYLHLYLYLSADLSDLSIYLSICLCVGICWVGHCLLDMLVRPQMCLDARELPRTTCECTANIAERSALIPNPSASHIKPGKTLANSQPPYESPAKPLEVPGILLTPPGSARHRTMLQQQSRRQ